MPKLPSPHQSGLFEPVLGTSLATWPWALPHLYAINVAANSEEALTGASASPDGGYQSRSALSDVGCVEVIGYWQGEFRVVHTQRWRDLPTAMVSAEADFSQLPIRYLLKDGVPIRENPAVEVTGTWPSEWKFVRIQDIGVLCAYLFETASAAGNHDQANRFRARITPASPATEQLLVYLGALKFAEQNLFSTLPEVAQQALHSGLSACNAWLTRS
jgi:hypothetical protein